MLCLEIAHPMNDAVAGCREPGQGRMGQEVNIRESRQGRRAVRENEIVCPGAACAIGNRLMCLVRKGGHLQAFGIS